MTTIDDSVMFILPDDKELIVPALATMQIFVREYDTKMNDKRTNNDTTPTRDGTYVLHWNLQASDEIKEYMTYLPMQLASLSEELSSIDMVIDLSEGRINKFMNLGKHAAQICGVMCGVHVPLPFPLLTDTGYCASGMWVVLEGADVQMTEMFQVATSDEFLNMQKATCKGLVGKPGWATMLAAARGMPVIELYEGKEPIYWLSKWSCRFYRVVDLTAGDVDRQVAEAIKSVNEEIAAQQLAIAKVSDGHEPLQQ